MKLQRKIGPLPLYAWALAALGAYLAYRWYQGRSSDSALGGTAADVKGQGYSYVPMGDQSGGGMGSATGGGAGMNGAGTQPITDVVGSSGAGNGGDGGGGVSSFTATPATSAVVTSGYNYGGGPESAPPPSSVYTNPSTGTVSVIPSGTVTPGGGITGRGVQGGL